MPTSRTITGVLCLAAICSPLVIAPFRLDDSLSFVREIENREPNAFPSYTNADDLIDASWWGSASRAFEDRVPFRQELITLNRTLLPVGSELVSEKIASGVDEWLFWRNSLAKDFGPIEKAQKAIDAMDHFFGQQIFDQQNLSTPVYLLVAPDKPTIYPEKLTPGSRSIYEQSLAGRELLHGWFAKPNAETNIESGILTKIDMWTALLARKTELDKPIYEPGGQHHNSMGAMVMAKAMIDVVDPSLWDEGEIVDLWTKTMMPELAKRGGDWDRQETYTRSQVQRVGVESSPCEDCSACQAESAKKRPHPSPHFVASSDSRKLIEGKTLIIQDSFIAMYLRPTLTQFFADVRFIHADDIHHSDILESLEIYDRVYIESVERYFNRRATRYFSVP